jgi:hypothetical protein
MHIYTNQARPPIQAKITQGWDKDGIIRRLTTTGNDVRLSIIETVVEQNFRIYGVVA